MKRLIRHRWPQAICGPVPSAWAVCAVGFVLALETDAGTRINGLYRGVFLFGLGLAFTAMARSDRRRSDRRHAEMVADCTTANEMLADRLIRELDTRLAAAGLGGDAAPLPQAQEALRLAKWDAPSHHAAIDAQVLDITGSGPKKIVKLPRSAAS